MPVHWHSGKKADILLGIPATKLTTTSPKILSPDSDVRKDDDSDRSDDDIAEDIGDVPGDIAFTEQSRSYLGWKTSYRECAAEKPCKVKALAKLRNKYLRHSALSSPTFLQLAECSLGILTRQLLRIEGSVAS